MLAVGGTSLRVGSRCLGPRGVDGNHGWASKASKPVRVFGEGKMVCEKKVTRVPFLVDRWLLLSSTLLELVISKSLRLSRWRRSK